MKCHEFETAVGADPKSTDPEVLAHLAQCNACAEYHAKMQQMDQLIYRALAIPLDAAPTQPIATKKGTAGRWQIAASLVASVMIASSIWIASTRETLAEQIVTHTDHEAFAIVRTDERVDAQTLNNILAKSGITLKENAADVSYAQSCLFNGHRVPHLVVQTAQGPVTVLVLAHEKPTKTMQSFDENGYAGVIVPAPRGVIAVLGKDVPVEDAVGKFLGEVEYR